MDWNPADVPIFPKQFVEDYSVQAIREKVAHALPDYGQPSE